MIDMIIGLGVFSRTQIIALAVIVANIKAIGCGFISIFRRRLTEYVAIVKNFLVMIAAPREFLPQLSWGGGE